MARRIESSDALSSCGPHPNDQPPPPIAHDPKPTVVISSPLDPSERLLICIMSSRTIYRSWLLSDISPSCTGSPKPSVLLEITECQVAPVPDFNCGATVVASGPRSFSC